MPITDQHRRLLELIAAGHSYDQILAANQEASYLDIFGAAQAALDEIDGPSYTVEEVRQQYPNAYKPWDVTDEAEVKRRAVAGESMEAIANALGRTVGAVQSRLVKVFLREATERLDE